MSKLEDVKNYLRSRIDKESYLVITPALAAELEVSEAALYRATKLLVLGEYSQYYLVDNDRKIAGVLVPERVTYKSIVNRRSEIFPS
jgi:hypothetical protein